MNTTDFTLQKFIESEFNTKEKLPFKTSIIKLKKKTDTIVPGKIEKNVYFIRSGIMQVSILDDLGDEKILSFSFPNSLCNSISSFVTQKPTEYTLTCVTDCVLEVISRDDLYNAMEHSILANKFMRYYLELAYIYRLKKQKDLLTKSAATRYNELLKEEPELLKLLPIATIAKYLGIHSRSLSRLRGGAPL